MEMWQNVTKWYLRKIKMTGVYRKKWMVETVMKLPKPVYFSCCVYDDTTFPSFSSGKVRPCD